MLNESSFAYLILTGEDIDKDDLLHARENVIHEAGLFQGRLGFSRSIICKEDGVEEFSNIRGIDQVRFSKGGIKEIYGEIYCDHQKGISLIRDIQRSDTYSLS